MTARAASRCLGRFAAVAVAWLLAACTAAQQPPTVTNTASDTTASDSAAPDNVAAEPTPQATPPVETARTPPATTTPKRSYPKPAALTQLDEPQIRNILGDPGFVRRDPPAEIWQYRTSTCVLYLFFYDNSGSPSLRYLEARGPKGEKLGTDTCIQQVIDARQQAAKAG